LSLWLNEPAVMTRTSDIMPCGFYKSEICAMNSIRIYKERYEEDYLDFYELPPENLNNHYYNYICLEKTRGNIEDIKNLNYIGILGKEYPHLFNEDREGVQEFYFYSPLFKFKFEEKNIRYIKLNRKILKTDLIIHETEKDKYFFEYFDIITLLKKNTNLICFSKEYFKNKFNVINSYLIFSKNA